MDFTPFPKIQRGSKAMFAVITEKIDGTNAQIVIKDGEIKGVGSRRRWITPDDDNFGFAKWVSENTEELLKLGEGQHFGEWYGSGIQCGYGLSEKKFALFDALRWMNNEPPACCQVVPILYMGKFSQPSIDQAMETLSKEGSILVPGFMNPEGIICRLPSLGSQFKETFQFSEGKWQSAA